MDNIMNKLKVLGYRTKFVKEHLVGIKSDRIIVVDKNGKEKFSGSISSNGLIGTYDCHRYTHIVGEETSLVISDYNSMIFVIKKRETYIESDRFIAIINKEDCKIQYIEKEMGEGNKVDLKEWYTELSEMTINTLEMNLNEKVMAGTFEYKKDNWIHKTEYLLRLDKKEIMKVVSIDLFDEYLEINGEHCNYKDFTRCSGSDTGRIIMMGSENILIA